MFLIVGLGNPEKKYEGTRHNAGFMALDEFSRKNNFPEFTLNKKSNALISEGMLGDQKIALAKPQTFMNNSGFTVSILTKNYKLKTMNLVVVHDDIDILLGRIKIAKSRGSAGHKGVESIIKSLGTKNFARIRVGIQPNMGKPEDVEKFVLQPFKKSELSLLQTAIGEATKSLSSLLEK